ncbi:MAG TPA: sugar phosphate isomerase/epimerase family protein [Limnochordia bacterium]|nr:sugar phosphate isomerase/epimerase family protein [Limnochordia bacterium]
MKLGLVTYNLAKDWTLDELLTNAREAGLAGVELRTTHAHGVEPELGAQARADVKRRVADSGIAVVALGTTCEFHAADAAVVEQHVETAKRFVELAKDIGARGVKVRPNGFVEGVSREQTLEQIGRALRRCGEAAQAAGVEIYLEMHGRETQKAEPMRRVMEVCDHPAVALCWNSNPTDVVDGSIAAAFERVAPWVRHAHITELHSDYPWAELFGILKARGYSGYCMAEIPASSDPLRLLKYYRALFTALQN